MPPKRRPSAKLRRPRRAQWDRGPTPAEAASPQVLRELAAMPCATPAVAQLAEALAARGMPRDRATLAAILRSMETHGLVEIWPDPGRAGASLVMLSANAANRLGLRLAPRGDCWLPADGYPAPRGFG